MSKSNLFGRYDPEMFHLKKAKIQQEHLAFLLLRSQWDALTLLGKLYHHTHFLLKKSALDMEVMNGQRTYHFPVFLENETLDEDMLLLIRNKSIEDENTVWIGFHKTSLCPIKRKKKDRSIAQLSMLLPEEEEEMTLLLEEAIPEQQAWDDFKMQLKRKSVSFDGKIDFVIPLHIATYEHFIPFIEKLNDFNVLHYQCIEGSEFENFEAVYYYLQQYYDVFRAAGQIGMQQKLQSLRETE